MPGSNYSVGAIEPGCNACLQQLRMQKNFEQISPMPWLPQPHSEPGLRLAKNAAKHLYIVLRLAFGVHTNHVKILLVLTFQGVRIRTDGYFGTKAVARIKVGQAAPKHPPVPASGIATGRLLALAVCGVKTERYLRRKSLSALLSALFSSIKSPRRSEPVCVISVQSK